MSLRKILTSKTGALLIILPYIKPASEITGRFDILFDIWKLISIAIIMLGYLELVKKREMISIAVILLQLTLVVSTIFHHGDIKTSIVDAGSNISLCCYMEYLLKKNIKLATRNFAIPCVFFAIITALSMFAYYPNGMYMVEAARENYFWGFDNTSAFRFFPTMYFLGIYAVERKNRKVSILSFLFMVFCTSAFLYVRSLTAGILMTMFTASFLYFVVLDKNFKHINTRHMVLVVIAISVILIVYKNNLTKLMEFAQKNDKFGSLSLRFTVWRLSIGQWLRNPVMGLGTEYADITMRRIILDHPHNVFLDVLYRGGLMALSCLAYIIARLVITKQRETKTNKLTAMALPSIFVIAQMDFYNAQYLFYPMLLLAYFTLKQKKNHNMLNIDERIS